MEKLIGELEATGATEIATKLREEWKGHSTALDTLKADLAAAKKAQGASEKEIEKLRKEVEASGKTTDERILAAEKERDAAFQARDGFKTKAEQLGADYENFRLSKEIEKKLGVADEAARDVAVDRFMRKYRPQGAGFDEKGALQGFDAAIDAFKKAETWAYPKQEPGHGGGRQGSDAKPNVTQTTGEEAAAKATLQHLYPQDFKQQGA